MRKIVAALLSASIAALGVQAPAQARTGLKIGVTMQATEYAAEFARFEDLGYQIDATRVFSSTLPPPWSDSRIQGLKARGIVPFVSWKTHDVTAVRNWLLAMPSDIPVVYLAEYHEAEANLTASVYKARQIETWNMINGLTSALRSRIRFGPIQTKQWTENNGRQYSEYDPGIGDFWGVDSYMNSWASNYPNHLDWLAQIRAYNTCRPTCRSKWLPELGAVSLPHDTTDFGRALFVDRVVKTIESDSQFGMVLWWQTEGTAGSHLPGLCTRRNFRLHERTTCNSSGVYMTTSPAPPETLRVYRDFMNRNTP